MSDFASAAMVRVLAQGMRELGLTPPSQALVAGSAAGPVATVSLALKRQVVASAVQQGGLACLAQLGRGLHHYRHDATHTALASARSAGDLFARWARLERYIHSRHRVEVLELGASQALLHHVVRQADAPPPSPAEDLVVLGLLVALLEALGLEHVQAWAGGVPVYPQADASALEEAATRLEPAKHAPSSTARWRLAWQGEVPLRAAGSGPARTAARPPPLVDDLLAPHTWPAPLPACARLLLADLAHPLALAALARSLRQPPRSLQRALARAGLGYAALLAELRCRAAAWWLLHTPTPIAEVGFVCGFADQPHFTRALRARVGMTPAAYREAFGGVSVHASRRAPPSRGRQAGPASSTAATSLQT